MTYTVYVTTSADPKRYTRVGQAETLDDAIEVAKRTWEAQIDRFYNGGHVTIRIARSRL